MFAPHCPTCGRQVLLGSGRIVSFAWDGDGEHVVVLRCFCGELVDWDQPRPTVDADRSYAEPARGWLKGA